MMWLRLIIVLLAGGLVGWHSAASNTALLEGMLVQAFSILSGVAIAGAFFFLQGRREAAVRTIQHLNEIRHAAAMTPLSDRGRQDILNRFELAGKATYKNSLLILVALVIFVIAVSWAHMAIPGPQWLFGCERIKIRVIHVIAFSAFFATAVATCDILSTAYVSSELGRDAPPENEHHS